MLTALCGRHRRTRADRRRPESAPDSQESQDVIHSSRVQSAEAVRWRGSRGGTILLICAGGCWRRSTAVAWLFKVSMPCLYKALAWRRVTGRSATGGRSSWPTIMTPPRPPVRSRPLLRSRIERLRRSMVARRPDVILEELRAWLAATHGPPGAGGPHASVPTAALNRCAAGARSPSPDRHRTDGP
jgi:hypothetical protein